MCYSEQPYIIETNDGAWLCSNATGPDKKGSLDQHVITLRNFDKGWSWTDKIEMEPIDGPEASYSVLFQTPYGRICIFTTTMQTIYVSV